MKTLIIGIDTGTNTGLAVWNKEVKTLDYVATVKIHEAMNYVKGFIDRYGIEKVYIRVEDARQRKWFGNSGREQLQGAGSIKRDAVIWEDFLKDLGADFEMVAPKNNKTKLTDEYFKQITGWKGRTSNHARDAVFLCYGY
jgi:hypothetical protein